MLRLCLALTLANVLCTSVLADMQTPTLTLTSPNSVVSPGEVLQFNCTTPNLTCTSVHVSLYKTEQSIKTKPSSVCAATFNLTVDSLNKVQYTCGYSNMKNNSKPSRPVNITVVNLQQPNISFSAEDGRFHWRSNEAEVTRGYAFSIICSRETQYPGGSFYLKFSGSSGTQTVLAGNHSAVFHFPEADLVHQGNYSCTYKVNVSSRTFTSNATELLAITVKASLALYIGVGVTAGLLLILVPVIICFVKMQKKRKYQMYKKKDTQCANDVYECPEIDDEADDEPEYINTETIFPQKEDSDDSDNDYINMDVNGQISNADDGYGGEEIYANFVE